MPRWDTSNEAMRKAVRWAMMDAYLATLRFQGTSPPEDFRREGGKLKFVPGAFTDKVAELLLQRGFRVNDDQEELASGGNGG